MSGHFCVLSYCRSFDLECSIDLIMPEAPLQVYFLHEIGSQIPQLV